MGKQHGLNILLPLNTFDHFESNSLHSFWAQTNIRPLPHPLGSPKTYNLAELERVTNLKIVVIICSHSINHSKNHT